MFRESDFIEERAPIILLVLKNRNLTPVGRLTPWLVKLSHFGGLVRTISNLALARDRFLTLHPDRFYGLVASPSAGLKED
jgi:hypothetical protein